MMLTIRAVGKGIIIQCWTPTTLKSMSQHYLFLSSQSFTAWKEEASRKAQPPEHMVDGMIESLLRAKHMNGEMFLLGVLHFSIFSMLIQEPERHRIIKNMSISAEWNNCGNSLSRGTVLRLWVRALNAVMVEQTSDALWV